MTMWPGSTKPSAGLVRYRQVRERMSVVLSACLGTLLPNELTATAKALGLWRHGELIAGDEMTRLTVFEAAAFHHRRGGETAVARTLRNLPANTPDLDRAIWEGCQRQHWSIFAVQRLHTGEGADLRDTLDGTAYRIWDEGAARDLAGGEHLSVRLIPVEDIWITSGPALVVPGPVAEAARAWLPAIWHDPGAWPAPGTADRDRLTLKLMSACLPDAETAPPPADSATRKGPCPCGSGKKYKHCCARM